MNAAENLSTTFPSLSSSLKKLRNLYVVVTVVMENNPPMILFKMNFNADELEGQITNSVDMAMVIVRKKVGHVGFYIAAYWSFYL